MYFIIVHYGRLISRRASDLSFFLQTGVLTGDNVRKVFEYARKEQVCFLPADAWI
jgi:hypothetical protein